MAFDGTMTAEEQALCDAFSSSSWTDDRVDYRRADLEQLTHRYTSDAISMPASHGALRGQDEIRSWYERRTGDYDMNVVAKADRVDIVGDIAVVVGIFRVTRRPEEGVAGLDHGGRYLMVMRRVDGEWRMWRDMDSPSPDADELYWKLPRGW